MTNLFFIFLLVFGVLLLLRNIAQEQKNWTEKIVEEQNRLTREQTKLLNDIKTQLLILNAKIDRNKDLND